MCVVFLQPTRIRQRKITAVANNEMITYTIHTSNLGSRVTVSKIWPLQFSIKNAHFAHAPPSIQNDII